MKRDGEMELIFDVSVLEVLADDGLIPVSMVAYPEAPYDQVLLEEAGMWRFTRSENKSPNGF